MSLLDEARRIAKQRTRQTGGAVYLYRYRSGGGYAIRDYARGPLPDSECELVEIIGAVQS